MVNAMVKELQMYPIIIHFQESSLPTGTTRRRDFIYSNGSQFQGTFGNGIRSENGSAIFQDQVT